MVDSSVVSSKLFIQWKLMELKRVEKEEEYRSCFQRELCPLNISFSVARRFIFTSLYISVSNRLVNKTFAINTFGPSRYTAVLTSVGHNKRGNKIAFKAVQENWSWIYERYDFVIQWCSEKQLTAQRNEVSL